jgi:cysteine desulfurase
MGTVIYLDYNATAPLSDVARDAWLAAQQQASGNPSSIHGLGQQARFAFDQARARIGQQLGVRPHEIIATSGGTEANALAVYATIAAWRRQPEFSAVTPEIVVPALEHSSLQRPTDAPELIGTVVQHQLPSTTDGLIDLASLSALLSPATALVCCQFANNELGTLQPIQQLVALVREHAPHALVLCDAAQGIGKLPVLPRELGVDWLSCAGHKCGAPRGTGFLYARTKMPVPALFLGGRQQEDRRSGTEDVAGLTALAAAIEHGLASWQDEQQRHATLLTQTFADIQAALPQVRWLGQAAPRLGNTMNIACPGVGSWPLATRLDLSGFAVSPGSACMAKHNKPSHVLQSLQVPEEVISGALRVSIGPSTNAEDLDAFAEAYVRAVNDLLAV